MVRSVQVDATSSGTATARRPVILTIDDDPNICQALKRRLSPFDVDVYQACSGMQGIYLATIYRPDVIVTDLRMPRGQGQNVVSWLKSETAKSFNDTPIIVLTGLHDHELQTLMETMGVSAYLAKPVDFSELCRVLRRFIDLKGRDDACEPKEEPAIAAVASGA